MAWRHRGPIGTKRETAVSEGEEGQRNQTLERAPRKVYGRKKDIVSSQSQSVNLDALETVDTLNTLLGQVVQDAVE